MADIAVEGVEEVSIDMEERIKTAKSAAEWQGVGVDAGVEVFRVEKLNVKKLGADQHGKFYDGDAYIVLHTDKNPKGELRYDIHYWLGNNCSIDERTVAAYKTIELDEKFETHASQYRETQGNESDKFISYFPKGIKVLHGGIASGFNQAKPSEKAPRLIQFKGRSVVQSLEVPAKASSLNHGDAFILEAGAKIFIWKGSQARQVEKFAASQYADQLKLNNETIVHLDSNGSDEFWALLKGKLSDVKSAAEGGDDSKSIKKALLLFKLSDSKGGAVKFDKVAEGKAVTMSQFHSNDAFLLDADTALFVWIGKNASVGEKRSAMNNAIKYLKQNNLPNSTPVERVLEGEESGSFKNALKQ